MLIIYISYTTFQFFFCVLLAFLYNLYLKDSFNSLYKYINYTYRYLRVSFMKDNICLISILFTLLLLESQSFAQTYWAKDNFKKGEIELHVGDFKEALNYYTKSIQSFPKYKDAYFSRAKTYLLLTDSLKAYRDLKNLIKLDSNQARAHFYLGVMAYRAAGFEQAIQDFDKALDINPTYALAYNYRAEAYKELGLTAPAIEDYTKAIEYESNVALLYFGRGKCYLDVEAYDYAIHDFDQAIALEARQNIYRQFRAETHFLAGNYYLASQDIDALQQIIPEDIPLHYHSLNAFCKAQNNNFEGAIQSMNKVIQNQQNNPESYAERASYYMRNNNLSQALNDYQTALSLDQDNPEYQMHIADLFFKLEDYQQAIHFLNQVILIDATHAQLWYTRGLAYLKTNRKKDAKFNFIKAANLGFPAEQMNEVAFRYAKKAYKKKRSKK